MMGKWLGVFAAVFALDCVWTIYVKAISGDQALVASGIAVLLILLSGIAQIGYVKDPRLLVPACIGAALGTYVSVKAVPIFVG